MFSASHSISGKGLNGGSSWEKKAVSLALVNSLGMKMVGELGQCAAERTFTEQDQFRRTSSFTERTQRSACALANAVNCTA